MFSDLPESRAARLRDRTSGAGLALLVQASFLALILLSPRHAATQRQSEKETIFFLRPSTPVEPTAADIIDARPPRQVPRSTVSKPAAPPAPSPTLAPPPAGLLGFGKSLFGCAPEVYANLTPDDRAHCPKPGGDLARNDQAEFLGHPSHAKYEALWEAELARKKSQLWLPCMGWAPTRSGSAVPSVDFVCMAVMAAQGKLTNPKEWPIYESRKYPAENLYKLQQMYDDWHRDHPDKREDNPQ